MYGDVERKLAEDCVHRMVKRAVEMEGTVTVGRFPVFTCFTLTDRFRASTASVLSSGTTSRTSWARAQ